MEKKSERQGQKLRDGREREREWERETTKGRERGRKTDRKAKVTQVRAGRFGLGFRDRGYRLWVLGTFWSQGVAAGGRVEGFRFP